jgi:hypothetical protein
MPKIPKKNKKKKRDFIYTISTICWDRKKKRSDSICRTWCRTFKQAETLITKNPEWFHESYYRWVLIERVEESGMVDETYERWYRFISNPKHVDVFGNYTYITKIKKPMRFKSIIGWSMSL